MDKESTNFRVSFPIAGSLGGRLVFPELLPTQEASKIS